jgi:hypothetical protein
VETGTVLDPHVQPGRPGAGYGFPFISTGKILVEQFASVCEPQPCLGKVLGRQAVVVDLHVDVAAVERAADKRYVNTLHEVIFAAVAANGRPMARMPGGGGVSDGLSIAGVTRALEDARVEMIELREAA